MSDTTPQRPSAGHAADADRDLGQERRDAFEMEQMVQDHATRAIERHLAMVADDASTNEIHDEIDLYDAPVREHDHSA